MVTGGAHGIGRAILAEARARGLIGVCLDIEPVEGGYVADIRDPAQVQEALARIWEDHGPISGLVNNAGVVRRALLLDTPPEVFAETLAVNLVGAYTCLYELAKRWEGEAHVVNITSAHAVIAHRERSAYAASKAGLESLTRSAALELGPRIKVYGLAAGFTQTEEGRTRLVGERAELAGARTPLGRVLTADEVARAAVDLVTGRYPAMTGQILRLDGGWSATDVELDRIRL